MDISAIVTQEKAEARDLLESNGLALFLVPEVTSSSLFLFLLTKGLYICVDICLLVHSFNTRLISSNENYNKYKMSTFTRLSEIVVSLCIFQLVTTVRVPL